MNRQRVSLFARATIASALALSLGCHREHWKGAKREGGQEAQGVRPRAATPLVLADASFVVSGHPRILLTEERMAAVTSMAKKGHPGWAELLRNCEEGAADKSMESGYEGEDWAQVALDLALASKALGRDDYGRAAVKYMLALVDDHDVVGDGKGGDAVVRSNDGYSIRNRGFAAAIAYDWLHDRLTPDQRAHMAGRFYAFYKWYKKDGYRHDEAISNHYMGFFGHTAMAGIAIEGDDPRGAEMRRAAREMWATQIIPQYRALEGGDFPEGWQYARLIGAVLGIYADAEARAGTPAIAGELPWLRESISFQTHAFFPDGRQIFDNADWSRKPAEAMADQLHGVAVAFAPSDPTGRRALHMARRAARGGWHWLRVIADPDRPIEDPRQGPLSYLARGTGTVFARTDWGTSAAWVSLNSGPFFGDHQHLDQGHFEVVRGGDALIIDPGDYDSYATTSHNSILVDDMKKHLRWSPNQGVWGKDCKIMRFEDAAGIAYAEADFTTAYDPDGYPMWRSDRAVTRAERALVFSRPAASKKGESGTARVVLYDRVAVTDPRYGVIWAAHSSVVPELDGATARVVVGASSASITTVLPSGARATLRKEPTLKTNDIFMKNDPAEGIASTRLEISSPNGLERRFLHVIAIGTRDARAPTAVRIEGEGVDGTAVEDEAYLFPRAGLLTKPASIAYAAPVSATRHVVTGLAPGGGVAVTFSRDKPGFCRVAIAPGRERSASSAGTLLLDAEACGQR